MVESERNFRSEACMTSEWLERPAGPICSVIRASVELWRQLDVVRALAMPSSLEVV